MNRKFISAVCLFAFVAFTCGCNGPQNISRWLANLYRATKTSARTLSKKHADKYDKKSVETPDFLRLDEELPEEENMLPVEVCSEEEEAVPVEVLPEEENTLPVEVCLEEEEAVPVEVRSEEEDALPVEVCSEEEDAVPVEVRPEEGDAVQVENVFVENSAQNEPISITPIHEAARSGNLSQVKKLVASGAKVGAVYDEEVKRETFSVGKVVYIRIHYIRKTVIDEAIASGNLELVKYLHEQGANCISSSFSSIAKSSSLAMVKHLVEGGLDVNSKDDSGRRALHSASENGNLQMVKYLVKMGADVNAKDNNGITALHCAAQSGNQELVNWLKAHGAEEIKEESPVEESPVEDLPVEDLPADVEAIE